MIKDIVNKEENSQDNPITFDDSEDEQQSNI
jgi:hypothetical protein